MAEHTKIEWADHTFNPWIGCQVASPDGCANCYAADWAKRYGRNFAQRTRTSEANWKQPLKWNAQAERDGRRFRVFCASLSDVFDNQAPDAWRLDLFALIAATPQLDWLLLTKRIGNVAPYLQRDGLAFDLMGRNVWLGITVVNQVEAERDIPKLLKVPARVRFLSVEPMIGPINFAGMFANPANPADGTNALEALDWIICGGESGHKARPMHPDWARSLRDQCAAADVRFLFKQWGEWAEEDTGLPAPLVAREGDPEFDAEVARHDGFISLDGHFVTASDDMAYGVAYRGLMRSGKKATGRLLDGIEHNEFPQGAVNV